ncbi:MAG: nucleotidyltransferase domain-containing protein [Halobaculum sp.]
MAPEQRSSVVQTVQSVLDSHPVSVGLLFGSHAREATHDRSDVDVAVVFDGVESGDSGYNDAFLGLSADLAVALGTDDVDLVDLEQAPASLVRTVLDHGVWLVGTEDEHDLRTHLGVDEESRSPTDRLEAALAGSDSQ